MAKGEVSSEMEKAVFWVQFWSPLWFKIFGNVIVTRVFFALQEKRQQRTSAMKSMFEKMGGKK